MRLRVSIKGVSPMHVRAESMQGKKPTVISTFPTWNLINYSPFNVLKIPVTWLHNTWNLTMGILESGCVVSQVHWRSLRQVWVNFNAIVCKPVNISNSHAESCWQWNKFHHKIFYLYLSYHFWKTLAIFHNKNIIREYSKNRRSETVTDLLQNNIFVFFFRK